MSSSQSNIMASYTSVAHLDLTLHNFLEKDINGRSLHVRALFEQAAMTAISYEQIDALDYKNKFVHIMGHEATFSFISNIKEVLTILCNYKPLIFNDAAVYELDDNLYGIAISAETIFTYASKQAVANIPDLATALTKSEWRTKPLLTYQNEVPQLVLRGCDPCDEIDFISTPANLACDANNIITQQLISYQNDLKRKEQQSLIEFPRQEGRGAAFAINNTPFHAYNSYVHNDQICEHMGLLHIDRSLHTWNINLRANLHYMKKLLTLENILQHPYESYSFIPAITEWQKNNVYRMALVMPLTQYIAIALAFQLSQTTEARIKREDGSVASDTEIELALNILKNYQGSLIKKIEKENSQVQESTPSFRPQ